MVFELFQDLDGFSLEEYRPFSNVDDGFERIERFLSMALGAQGQKLRRSEGGIIVVEDSSGKVLRRMTIDRERVRGGRGLSFWGSITGWL